LQYHNRSENANKIFTAAAQRACGIKRSTLRPLEINSDKTWPVNYEKRLLPGEFAARENTRSREKGQKFAVLHECRILIEMSVRFPAIL